MFTVNVWVISWENVDMDVFNSQCTTDWLKTDPEAYHYSTQSTTNDPITCAYIARGLLWENQWESDGTVTYWEVTAA